MKSRKFKRNYSLPYTAKGKIRSSIVISLIIICIVAGIGIIEYNKRNPGCVSQPEGVLLPIAIIIVLQLILRAKLIIKEDRIIHISYFFTGRQEILISDIKRMEIVMRNRKGAFILNLYDDKDFFVKPFVINIGLFREKDILTLIDAITKKVSSIEMDDFTRQLKNGDFKGVKLGAWKLIIKSFLRHV